MLYFAGKWRGCSCTRTNAEDRYLPSTQHILKRQKSFIRKKKNDKGKNSVGGVKLNDKIGKRKNSVGGVKDNNGSGKNIVGGAENSDDSFGVEEARTLLPTSLSTTPAKASSFRRRVAL